MSRLLCLKVDLRHEERLPHKQSVKLVEGIETNNHIPAKSEKKRSNHVPTQSEKKMSSKILLSFEDGNSKSIISL